MKKYTFPFLFILWITLSLFIRTVGLNKSPASAGFDEVSLGYNSYSLLLTGKDEYGNLHPLSLRSYNDFKPALYAYLAIPFIKVIGLNEVSTRLPSAIFGTLSLIFTFLIFKKLSGRSNAESLLAVAVVSFFPWRIHFSRVAFETNISMAFFTAMVWCLINLRQNFFYKIGVIFFSILAIYSYHSSRVAVPIMIFLSTLSIYWIDIKKSIKNPLKIIKLFWPLLLVIILYIPLFLEFRASLLLTRFSQTSIFSHFNGVGIYKMFGILTGHFLSYVSLMNLSLLIYPGVIKSAQVISGSGMMGLLGGILFMLGLPMVRKNKILLLWIIAGSIPAVVTWEWFYPLRALNIFPALDIIAGFGIIYSFIFIFKQKVFIRNILLTLFVAITFMFSFYTLLNEFNYSAWDTGGEFQPGGFKQGVPILMSLKNKYKTVYLDSNQAQSYEIFWFYMNYSPLEVQKLAGTRNVPGKEGPPTINFGNFVYKKFDWPRDRLKSNFIYWTSSEVKEDEINSTPGSTLYKIFDQTGNWIASIVTKE